MKDESIIKIGHNIKYDNSILNKYGVEVRGFHDTMLMSYVLDAGVNRHNMDELANICLLYTSPSPRDVHLSRMPSSA